MSVRGGIVPVLVLLSLALPVRADDPAEGEVVHLPDRDVYVHNPNYDVAKIPSYVLEDPLTFLNGRKVTAANWEDRRREILGIFAREMYGAEPPAPEAVVTEGEFLSVRAASPAWGLLRGSGLPEVSWPAPYDEDVLLSDETPPEVTGGTSDALVARAWRWKGETYLVVVNCRDVRQEAAVGLSESFGRVVASDFGPAPVLQGGSEVRCELPPLGYVMVRLK